MGLDCGPGLGDGDFFGYVDAEPSTPIESYDPKLAFGPIRVNFQILEVWAPQLPLSVAV